MNHCEPVLLEISPPPVRMEQPKFRDDVAALAVPARKTKTDRVSNGSVPGLSQSLQLSAARPGARQQLRQRRAGEGRRLEIGNKRAPQAPGVGRQKMNAIAAQREP